MRKRGLGDEVVSEPVCELRKRIRGQRRDDEEIGAGQVGVEILGGRAPGEREERVGPDEPVRAGRDERNDLMPALDEQAHEVTSLVGGDPTGDADQHSSHAGILPFWQSSRPGRKNYFGYLYLSLPSETSSRAMVK